MARFWLGTFKIMPPVAPTGLPAEPLVADGARAVAIEVINDGDEYAVLFSTLEDADTPASLVCGLGLANGARFCAEWHDRGFPLVDAIVAYDEQAGRLQVSAPYFAEPETKHAMLYEEPLVAIEGLNFDAGGNVGIPFNPVYLQFQQSPDPVSPADWLLRKAMRWLPKRTNVKKSGPVPQFKVTVEPSRLPSLRPFGAGTLPLANAWSGKVDLPSEPATVGNQERAKRADIFGVPAFRFESIEVVGFRIELEELPYSLVTALNVSPSFTYVPTTAVVLLELLRYGSMRLQEQDAPLTDADFQSQHELVVRVLAGRIPLGGTVPQNPPAVWVPAIFVDNPWSKGLGRDVQGFDKRMAEFRIQDKTRLRPDGCSSPQNPPVGLVKVVAINLPQRAGDIGAAGQPLLDISYDVPLPPNGVNFQRVAPGVRFPHGGPRWRKEDFDLKERGAPFELDPSFVDLAVSYSFFDFLSLQLAPAGKRMFDNAFIRSTFKMVGQPEFEEPSVTGAITLHTSTTAPPAWNALCRLVGLDHKGTTAKYSFVQGGLYRLKFSMNMTVNDR